MSLAFIFPGQGSQYPGMGSDLYEKYPFIRKTWDLANRILKFDLKGLMFEGSKDELKKTYFAQPAIAVSNYAHFQVLIEKGLKPAILLGNSVGEYTAFLAANMVSLHDIMHFVKERGSLMTECIPEKEKPQPYTPMTAVFTNDSQVIDDVCFKYDLEVGNHNPGQYILTGLSKGIQNASKELKSQKILSKPLKVEGPWHSKYMTGAKEGLEGFVSNLSLKNPKIPYLANLNTELVTTVKQMKQYTPSQVNHTVLWKESIDKAISLGIDSFIECGSGNIQEKMIARAYPETNYPNIKVLKKKDYI